MSVLAIDRVRVDPPVDLPVSHISVSSLRQLKMCPWKWKARYIDKILEPPSGKMVLGSAADAALSQHFGWQIERGTGLTTEEILDEFSAEWDHRTAGQDVAYGKDVPGKLKDTGAAALRIYHRIIAPKIVPVSVQREVTMRWPGVNWCLTGYLDVETARGIRDYKMTTRRISKPAADRDLQATIYLADRRAEGWPADDFHFDSMLRQATPSAEEVRTTRTEAELDGLTDLVFKLALEIEWRTNTDNWTGAPPNTWFCDGCRLSGCPWRRS